MTFEEIQAEYNKDVQWEFSKTDKYLQLLPVIISKYQNHWFAYKKELDKLEIEHDDKWISRFTYYKNDFDIKLSATEIKDFLSKDSELNKIRKKTKMLISIIEWIEKALKNLDNIRWDISRTIEFEKFKAGEF